MDTLMLGCPTEAKKTAADKAEPSSSPGKQIYLWAMWHTPEDFQESQERDISRNPSAGSIGGHTELQIWVLMSTSFHSWQVGKVWGNLGLYVSVSPFSPSLFYFFIVCVLTAF